MKHPFTCGAYFPLFDRNPNTAEGPFGKSTAIATESVYHTSAKPSRRGLPLENIVNEVEVRT